MAPDQPPRLIRFYNELKRRRVFGSAAAYVVLAALLIELSRNIFDALLFPDWAARLFTVIMILGFPIVVVLAWFFDISYGRVKRTGPAVSEPVDSERGLQAALRHAHSVPVPVAPVRRRAQPASPFEEAEEAGELDADRVREATLGHARHELRTPINGIIGYAEMLLEDVDDDALTVDLERIRTAGHQLLSRVDAVLRPGGLSGESAEDLEAFGERVRVDLRTPINAVVGYAEMLVEACEEEEGRNHLLPDLERILASARRLLGLSEDIVGIATMGSEAPVSDTLAAGSALTRDVLSKIRPGGGGALEGEGRLLVIDDNETNRDLLSRQLARHGYVVATASDGEQGLARLEKEDYDLILLDVIMPHMDGVETLRRLRADERWAEIPVIMLSSLDEVDSAVRCIEMGALDYVSKPVQPTLLEARIAAALEIRELHRRERAYLKRVAADRVLIDRLLTGAVPSPLRARVAEGTLDVVETYPDAAVIRCIVAPELRPTAADAERVRGLAALLTRLEGLMDVAADICLWRTDGFVAVLAGADGGGADTRRAADLVLQAREAVEGGRAAFGLHAGAAIGGLLGRDRPRYEVWGEAVDTAEALARLASPGEVLVTAAAEGGLRDSHILETRGVRNVSGNQMRVHALIEAREGSGSERVSA